MSVKKLSGAVFYVSLLAFTLFVVYVLYINQEVFYTAHERSEFIFGTPFFDKLMAKPFGLIQYAGAWLTLLFYLCKVGEASKLCVVGEASKLCVVGEASKLCIVGEASKLCKVGEASKLCSADVVGEASKLCKVGEASKLCRADVVGEASKLRIVGEASKLCIVGEASKLCVVGEASKLCKVGEVSKLCEVGEASKLCEVGEASKLCVVGEASKLCVVGEASKLCIVGEAFKLCEKWNASQRSVVGEAQSLEASPTIDLTLLNSDGYSDSYPSWSSNGHWIMCASRRDDDNYSRVYFAYFNNGKVEKAFLLPQEDPELHICLLKSYNRPEFIVEPVRISVEEFSRVFD